MERGFLPGCPGGNEEKVRRMNRNMQRQNDSRAGGQLTQTGTEEKFPAGTEEKNPARVNFSGSGRHNE